MLEIESHEEGFLHILLPEGEDALPDEAIAVVVEHIADIGPLRHADAPEIFARGAVFLHVTVCEQGKIRVWPAITIGISRIHRKA